MKHIYNYLGSLLLIMAIAFTACSPEEFTSPSQSGLPQISNIVDGDIDIAVDQTINQVTFTLKKSGCMPVWIFDGKSYSTVNGLSRIYTKAGTYTVDVKVANANGISDGFIQKEFTIENTVVDFSSYVKRLAGDSSKEWRIAKSEAGHLGCGEPGTDGLNWYSAQPDEKADMGLYDDRITFTTERKYTYNPGEGGTVFVNVGCSIFSEYNTTGKDFMATVSEQTADYDFDIVGDDIYITLPPQTLFPYIAYDDAYNNPRYKIANLTASRMELIADNGDIAWHYILISGEEKEDKPGGYDPDSEFNMWKSANITTDTYYAPGWNQIEGPAVENNNGAWSIGLPEATTDQWQAQVKLFTDLSTNEATNYDFSAMFNSNKDHNNVTVKLTKHGDDGVYYFVETIRLKAFEDYVFIKSDMPGIDMENVDLVLDFGGNEAGTEVTVSRIVLKDHANDDGTVIEDNKVVWDEGEGNIWNTAQIDSTSTYYAQGDSWTLIEGLTVENSDGTWTFTLPEPTNNQWQAQVKLYPDNISADTETSYDFRCIISSTTDVKGATIKLVDRADDNNFFFTKNVDLPAYEEVDFQVAGVKAPNPMDRISLVFDFGGNPANTVITVKGIILQKSAVK